MNIDRPQRFELRRLRATPTLAETRVQEAEFEER
jgi:hypothetical protein